MTDSSVNMMSNSASRKGGNLFLTTRTHLVADVLIAILDGTDSADISSNRGVELSTPTESFQDAEHDPIFLNIEKITVVSSAIAPVTQRLTREAG